MSEPIKINQLSFGSLFKILFNAKLVFWIIGGIAMGVGAMNGMDTVTMNGQPVHGPLGVVLGMVIALLLGTILGSLSSLLIALLIKLFGGLLPFQNIRSS